MKKPFNRPNATGTFDAKTNMGTLNFVDDKNFKLEYVPKDRMIYFNGRKSGIKWRKQGEAPTKEAKADAYGKFVNIRDGRALDVSGAKDNEGQAVIVHKGHNGLNQKWKVVYVDKSKKEATSGFSEEWGMHINRPFVLRSRMYFHRVMQCHGAVHMRLNRYKGNKALDQQFFFDMKTKTIQSQQWKNRSLEIHSNGNHIYTYMKPTNSRWW